MAIRDLVTKFGKKSVPVERSQSGPIDALHEEIDRVFENFGEGFFNLSPISTHLLQNSGLKGFLPSVDVKESDTSLEVTIELPGVDEKDIQVLFSKDELVIRGEKKTEKEEKGKEWYRMERSYGSFHRTIPLPSGVDSNKAEAIFRKGVLTITAPKFANAKQEAKKITIRRE